MPAAYGRVVLLRAPGKRRVRLRGCFNLRDLGGYPTIDGRATRYGRLFRSDSLHALTPTDQDDVIRLGFVTVIDLRTRDEVADDGPARVGATHHHLPMDAPRCGFGAGPVAHAEAALVAETYAATLAGHVEIFREVLAILTDPSSYPAVMCSSSGVERTGVVTAMLLGLLGVADESIVSDFAGSREAVLRRIGRLRFEHPALVSGELDRHGTGLLGVVPEAMSWFLDRVRQEHGSFEGYADSIDMAGAVPYLRAVMLEP